jgi:nitrogen regulatory protein P-II 1
MKKLEIIIRPDKLELLKEILNDNGCNGMTILAVMGCGTQKGNSDESTEYKGMTVNINLLPKIQVTAVIQDELLEQVMAEIHTKVSTGHVGDGKVFVSEISDAMRIRTGERGAKVI